MVNPVEVYYGTTRLFRFDPMPTNVTFDLNKVGNSPMDLPSYIRPWMFDFTSQQRTLTIRATLINRSSYDADYPGTGSILDQIEDLMYIMSGNWNTSNGYLQLFIPYPTAIDATHNLSTMYPSTGNSDYALDAASIPNTEWPVGSSVLRTLSDKIYYVYPQSMNVDRDEASVNRVHVTLTFQEVQDVLKI
jgi:hypothetical protein